MKTFWSAQRLFHTRGVIAIPLMVVSLLGLGGCERWALDRQMEELCKKDGGIKVYEVETLSAAELEALHKYVTVAKSAEDYYGPNYRYVSTRDVLVGKSLGPNSGKGQLARVHRALYRRSDNRLLGEQVEYRRTGGDFFTFGFQPTRASCPHFDRDVAQTVFVLRK